MAAAAAGINASLGGTCRPFEKVCITRTFQMPRQAGRQVAPRLRHQMAPVKAYTELRALVRKNKLKLKSSTDSVLGLNYSILGMLMFTYDYCSEGFYCRRISCSATLMMTVMMQLGWPPFGVFKLKFHT